MSCKPVRPRPGHKETICRRQPKLNSLLTCPARKISVGGERGSPEKARHGNKRRVKRRSSKSTTAAVAKSRVKKKSARWACCGASAASQRLWATTQCEGETAPRAGITIGLALGVALRSRQSLYVHINHVVHTYTKAKSSRMTGLQH